VPREFVFGYGSLSAEPGALVPCRLHGWRRGWTVAMDNRRTIPGYKYWVSPADGSRPPLTVCSLDVAPAAGAVVAGAALPVPDAAVWAALDVRERNYTRVEVTDALDADVGGRVWTYVGRDAARERAAAGRAAGEAVVARPYLETVRAGLAALGLPEVEAPDVPVVDLRRVDVPASLGADG
jgi:cation transport regulator ChaC